MVELWVNAKTGNDNNPGTQEHPLATTQAALGKLSGNNDLVHMEGIFSTGLRVTKSKYPGHVIFDGHDKTLLYGFEGQFKEYDPANPPSRTYKALSIMDVHNLTVRNMYVWGGVSEAVHLDDSYPNIGMRNIHLENIRVRYGGSRGIFMGGSNIDGIYIDGCEVAETCYGDTTHNIYLSGGHWTGSYPPIKNIRISKTVCKYSGGRHGIQLNGRFQNVKISGNKLFHNELGGLSLIGCQDVVVEENEIYGNQRQPIIIYDYFDTEYFDPNDPESVEEWKQCHHPNDRILIKKNTLFVGPTQWHKDAYHNNSPKRKACVIVNNEINKMFPYRQFQIGLQDNVMVSPWNCIIRFTNMPESAATYVIGNLIWTYEPWKTPCVEIPYGAVQYDFDWLHENASQWYKDNIVSDPYFVQQPEYQFVDRTITPYFNFGKDHQTKANLFSEVAANLNKGKTYAKSMHFENPFNK